MHRNLVRAYIAALVITSSLAAPVTALGGETNPLVRVRIGNFGQVSPTYYRGAQPEGRDYADLASLGVRTIIDLTGDDAAERSLAERAGMRYVRIPMTTHQPPTAAQLTEFMRIAMDPASQPIYVHCVGGRHRTGVMTAVYRMTHDGWSAAQAFKEMKRYRFGADFLHPEFKKFVYAYPATPAQAAPAAASMTKSGS